MNKKQLWRWGNNDGRDGELFSRPGFNTSNVGSLSNAVGSKYAGSRDWEQEMQKYLDVFRGRLLDVDEVEWLLGELAVMLRKKHEQYGEDNLKLYGEYGILIRCSDKIARLKHMLETGEDDSEESRRDTWQDLAGYAVQALILMDAETSTPQLDEAFEIRKNRLNAGICPDCGEGGLIYTANLLKNKASLCCSDCLWEFWIDLNDETLSLDPEALFAKIAAEEPTWVLKRGELGV